MSRQGGGAAGSGGTIFIEIYDFSIKLGNDMINSYSGSPKTGGCVDVVYAIYGSGAGHVVVGDTGVYTAATTYNIDGSVGRIAISVPDGVTITGQTTPNYYNIRDGVYHTP